MFKNIKIGTRLTIVFSFILLLFAALTLFGINRMEFLADDISMIYNHPLAVSNAALRIKVDTLKIHRDMKDVVLARDRSEVDSLAANVEEHEACVLRDFKIVSERFLGEREKYEEAVAIFNAWRPIRDEVFALMRSGKRAEAVEITKGKGARHLLKIEEALNFLDEFAHLKATDFFNQAGQAKKGAFTTMYSLFGFAALACLGLAVIITRSITRPLEELRRTAVEIGKGRLDTVIEIDSGDELGELASSFGEMTGNLKLVTASRDDLDREILERKRAEEALKESEENYRSTFEQNVAGIVVTDSNAGFLNVNAAFCNMLGYSKEEMMQLYFSDITVPEDKQKSIEMLEKIQRRELEHFTLEKRYRHKNGSQVYTIVSGVVLYDEEGRHKRTIATIEDITERKRGEEALLKRTKELKTANDELHDLTVQMTRVEDVERKRFAELLHEGIGQNLVAVKLAYDNYMFGCKDQTAAADFLTEEVRHLLDDTIKTTREMTTSIYPAPLRDMELVDALKWYVENLLGASGVSVSLNIDDVVESLPEETQRSLFSIIRESFQNIFKYASATKVTVTCVPVGGVMRLTIKDNGVGFSEEEVRVKKEKGIGQSLMREWVTAIGGDLKIHSAPGMGAEVCVEFVVA